MKPFCIKNLINKNIFDWDDFNFLLKNHPKDFIELIDKEGNKKKGLLENEDITGKNVIFTKAFNYKKEFEILKDFFKLKVLELNKSFDWDVHVYTGHEDNCRSFGAHYDKADNFIVQTEGESNWILKDSFTTVLKPGDALFIPKLWIHECKPLTKRISLSFPFWYKNV